ncbi:MAG: hypothetical protein IJE51_02495 [Clostridia bacterium]|nr:hypothetical protein [Clostridia bacterium]
MLKKIISIVIAILIINCITCSTIANNKLLSVEEIKNNLLCLGIPKQLIDTFDDEELFKYKNLQESDVTKKIFKIVTPQNILAKESTPQEVFITEVSHAEYLNSTKKNQTRGLIDESYLEITFTHATIDHGHYKITAFYHWLSTPTGGRTHYLAITLNESLNVIPNTVTANQGSTKVNLINGNEEFYMIPASVCAEGIGGKAVEIYTWADSNTTMYYNYIGYLTYEAEVSEDPFDGTLVCAAFYTYAQAKLAITIIPTITISQVLSDIGLTLTPGFTISPATYFDFMNGQQSWDYYNY